MADRGFPLAEETAIARRSAYQAGFGHRERGAASDGRPAYSEEELVELLPAALPRLDDRRRIDRDPQEQIAEAVFERSFSQRPG